MPILRLNLKLTELHSMTTFCVIQAHTILNFNYNKNLKDNKEDHKQYQNMCTFFNTIICRF